MVPASRISALLLMIPHIIGAAVIGILTGWLTSLVTRTRPKRPFTDGLVGIAGFPAGSFGAIMMPWHRNTVSYETSNGITVTTTANFYQHPLRIGVIVAIILTLLFELSRCLRARRSEAST